MFTNSDYAEYLNSLLVLFTLCQKLFHALSEQVFLPLQYVERQFAKVVAQNQFLFSIRGAVNNSINFLRHVH